LDLDWREGSVVESYIIKNAIKLFSISRFISNEGPGAINGNLHSRFLIREISIFNAINIKNNTTCCSDDANMMPLLINDVY